MHLQADEGLLKATNMQKYDPLTCLVHFLSELCPLFVELAARK